MLYWKFRNEGHGHKARFQCDDEPCVPGRWAVMDAISRFGMTRNRPEKAEIRRCGWIGVWMLFAAGCGGPKQPVEKLVVSNPTLGAVSIAVAPALNQSGSTEFDASRVADLMAGELMHAERVTVVPVSRVLAVLASQGTDRVNSPAHATEVAGRVGADAILVFAVTEYDPYDPPSVSISAQLYAANPRPAYGAPDEEGGESKKPAGGRMLAQTQARFDATHADVVADIKEYARRRGADESPYGWRRFVVSQQDFIRYCCHATIRGLLNGQGWQVAAGEGRRN